MRRRRLLTLCGGTLSVTLAGCVGPLEATDAGLRPDSWDDHCPGSTHLDIDFPDDLTRSAVNTFVTTYTEQYLQEVHYELTMFHGHDASISPADGPSAVGDGYEGELGGRFSTIEPAISIEATQSDDAGDDLIELTVIDQAEVVELFETAAETGEAEASTLDDDWLDIDVPALLASFDENVDAFEAPTEFGQSGTMSVEVDGTVVEVTITLIQGLIGDLWFEGNYYVDDVGLVLELLSGDISVIECRED